MSRFAPWILFTLAIMAAPAAVAQTATYAFVQTGDAVKDKNFYLLSVLETDPTARAAIAGDADLRTIRDRAVAGLRDALARCTTADCVVGKLTFSEDDVTRIGVLLAGHADGPLKSAIRTHLRPSGLFQAHAALDDRAFIRAAWEDTAHGVNRLYRVYALAEAPRYPAIDSMSYKPDDKAFLQGLRTALEVADDGIRPDTAFFGPWTQIGLDLLLISQRDEAARYEPLSAGENAASLRRAAKTDWGAFPYSAILVPGAGLSEQERGLSAVGALRLRLAVRRYRQGLAPFIIVSGGHVHPDKTPYNEAIEMKRELLARYVIPESAVLVDPHARHTTTNLRNAARVLFRAGAPLDRAVLVTTSPGQSAYIESEIFKTRNQDELGYQPITARKRLSAADLEMSPSIASLQADPRDPLDP